MVAGAKRIPWNAARSPQRAEEHALAMRARTEQAAFGTLYDRYLAPIYAYCYRRLGRREAAEDATAAVFTKALAAIGQYRADAPSFRTSSKKDIDETGRSNVLVRFLFADWSDWIGILLNPTRDTLKTSYDEAGRQALAQLDLDQSFDQEHDRAISWLETNALTHATSIADTVKGEVSDLIVKAVKDGKGAEDIAADISGYFTSGTEWKALHIARTEVISGYAQGSLEEYKQSGIVNRKQRLTAGDSAVDAGDATGPLCDQRQARPHRPGSEFRQRARGSADTPKLQVCAAAGH